MIKSFRCKNTRKVFEGKMVAKWSSTQKQLERRLQVLDEATCLEDLKHLPSNRFESLVGNRKTQFSIRVNIRWRLCFKWIENEAHDVEMMDYH
jgi:toxin HigB-1